MANEITVNYLLEKYAKTNFKICLNMQKKLYVVPTMSDFRTHSLKTRQNSYSYSKKYKKLVINLIPIHYVKCLKNINIIRE